MTEIKSKYRPITIAGMILGILISAGMLIWSSVAFVGKYNTGKENIIIPFIIFSMLLLTILFLSITNMKDISISSRIIKYRYTLFPFATFIINIENVDGYTTVMEKRSTTFGAANVPIVVNLSDKEAIWLFSNGRLRLRLSSMVYKNYDTLKNSLIDVPRLDIDANNSIAQLLFMIRLKRYKN